MSFEETETTKLKEPVSGQNNTSISFSAILSKHNINSKLDKNSRLVERLVVKLSESQSKILEFVKSDSYITIKELAFKIGISTTAIDKNIVLLKKKGLLKRIGPDKGGRWAALKQKKRELNFRKFDIMKNKKGDKNVNGEDK